MWSWGRNHVGLFDGGLTGEYPPSQVLGL
jgi:hypothetical protein